MYHNDVLRPSFGFGGFVGQTPAFGWSPVYNQAPTFGQGYGFGFNPAFNPMAPTFGATAPYAWNATTPAFGLEHTMIQHRVDALTGQIAQLTDLVCRTNLMTQHNLHGLNAHGVAYPGAVYPHASQPTVGLSSGRVRESDSHLFWEVAFPGLSMGDLDIEVNGNRVICRTRIPLRTQLRAVGQLELPRGLEIFELPDGRIELNWLVPVTFVGKEVEATWKDGWVQICIPKTEIGHRQSVKITADASASNGVRKNGARDLTA